MGSMLLPEAFQIKRFFLLLTVQLCLIDARPAPAGGAARVRRPGHDRRYAVDTSKIQRELDWSPACTFERGIRETVKWYLDHQAWVQDVQSGAYTTWLETNYQNGEA